MTDERLEQATPDTWMRPPEQGWSHDQVKDLELPFDWELVDGEIVPRGMTHHWHDQVRDGLFSALHHARRAPYGLNVERCVMVDEHTVIKPDIVVYDKQGLDVFTLECVPVDHVALAVEVVSPGSRARDKFAKPGLLSECSVAYYWRVERGEDDFPVVHELWLHHDMGMFVPAPERPIHTGKLVVNVPFPVEIDLQALVTG